MESARQRLLELLRATVSTGSVKLSSGKITDFYVDGRQVTLNPEGLAWISELALEAIHGRCDAVGGPTSGADPIVAGIGLRAHDAGLPLRLFFIRKEAKGHGLKRRIEGPELHVGDRVALVDDVATSGGSLVQAAEVIRQETRARPALALVVVDRQEGARESLEKAGLEFVALFSKSEILAEH